MRKGGRGNREVEIIKTKPVVSRELSVLEQLQSGESLDLVDLAQFFLDSDIDWENEKKKEKKGVKKKKRFFFQIQT